MGPPFYVVLARLETWSCTRALEICHNMASWAVMQFTVGLHTVPFLGVYWLFGWGIRATTKELYQKVQEVSLAVPGVLSGQLGNSSFWACMNLQHASVKDELTVFRSKP